LKRRGRKKYLKLQTDIHTASIKVLNSFIEKVIYLPIINLDLGRGNE
jgi:hypothetical protein